jgi:hypothetical protein
MRCGARGATKSTTAAVFVTEPDVAGCGYCAAFSLGYAPPSGYS